MGSSSPRSRHHAVSSTGMSGGIWPPEWLPTTRNGPCSGTRSNPLTSDRKYETYRSRIGRAARRNAGSRAEPTGAGVSAMARTVDR